MIFSLSSALLGPASERPNPNDSTIPRNGSTPPTYICIDTLQVFQDTGTEWLLVGTLGSSYPGVTSPGSGQLAMPGGITVGAGGEFSQFTGALAIASTQADYSNGNAPLGVEQDGTLDADDGLMPPTTISRFVNRNGRTVGNPVLDVFSDDASAGAHPIPASEPVFRTGSTRNQHITDYADGSMVADSGVGAYGIAPPSSRPNLTLAVSTITDPDAQATISALIGIIVGCGFASVATT